MAIISSMGANEMYADAYRNKTEQHVKEAQKARLEKPEKLQSDLSDGRLSYLTKL